VGQAICAGKLKLNDRAAAIIPELEGKPLGNATVQDLLRMASGAAESTNGPFKGSGYIFTPQEAADFQAGKLNIVQTLASDRVSRAAHGVLSDYKPGEQFAYKGTDPLTLGVMLNRATGVSTAQWMQEAVFDQVGIAEVGKLNTLCAPFAGSFCTGTKQAVRSDAGVFLHLNDWVRFAWWVKQASKKSDCFGKFVNEASHTQISTARPGTKWGKNSVRGYGYLTWTENPIAPNTYWAEGWGGQRIGWNYKNDRMVISFSNHEIWIPELYALYRDWMNAAD
jgi:CubicO group peptidase (beta-lactamase class C family)